MKKLSVLFCLMVFAFILGACDSNEPPAVSAPPSDPPPADATADIPADDPAENQPGDFIPLPAVQPVGIPDITATDLTFLKADGRDIKNDFGKGDIVNLRGTNIGGWLLQEFWMTPTNYTANANAEMDVYNVLTDRFGAAKMYELVDLYQSNYFTETDMDNLADLGMNCIRLPFWWRNLTDQNGAFYPNPSGLDSDDPYAYAFRYIDWFIQEAGKRNMYVIIDMHGCPGSQSGSDHSGVDGGNRKEAASEFFFGENAPRNQEIFYDIWEVIAARYKGNPVVAAYDLINEPYCTYRYNSSRSAAQLHDILWTIYDEAYKKIRAIDPDHMICMAATWDPIDLPQPDDYGWENVLYQYHNYAQGTISNLNDALAVVEHMERKLNLIIQAGYEVPSLMGEFNFYGNMRTWDDGLKLFNDCGISWTHWTYKTTGNNGNWGIYHHTGATGVDVEKSEESAIRFRWEQSGLSKRNDDLADMLEKYYRQPMTPNTMVPQQFDLADGTYYFTGRSGNAVTVNTDGENILNATSGGKFDSSDTQIFVLENNGDGTISLKSQANGKYVSVRGNNRLYAEAGAITDSEKFLVFAQSRTSIALKSVSSGKYVCADENLSGVPLVADRDAASSWETLGFNLIE